MGWLLLQLPVSPAARWAITEKKNLGVSPRPPARGVAPCIPLLNEDARSVANGSQYPIIVCT